MLNQIRIAREYNRDSLNDWFRGEQNVSPIDWNAAVQPENRGDSSSQAIPSEPVVSNTPDKQAQCLDAQVVPEVPPIMIPLSALSPNSYNELSSIAASQDLQLTDEQNAQLIEEHIQDSFDNVAFSAVSSLFDDSGPSLNRPPIHDPELDSAIRPIAEQGVEETIQVPHSSSNDEANLVQERPADGNRFPTDSQQMETDGELSPVFSPITTSASFEFSVPSNPPQASQPTASSHNFSQELSNRMQASTLSSGSSNPSPKESPIRPPRPASKPASTSSQPPQRRSSSRAVSPHSSTDRGSQSSGSGISLLQATRTRTAPKLVVPKPKKKTTKDKEKKKKK